MQPSCATLALCPSTVQGFHSFFQPSQAFGREQMINAIQIQPAVCVNEQKNRFNQRGPLRPFLDASGQEWKGKERACGGGGAFEPLAGRVVVLSGGGGQGRERRCHICGWPLQGCAATTGGIVGAVLGQQEAECLVAEHKDVLRVVSKEHQPSSLGTQARDNEGRCLGSGAGAVIRPHSSAYTCRSATASRMVSRVMSRLKHHTCASQAL
eukprot:113183-Pelagomonas_calceolata.AAC.6